MVEKQPTAAQRTGRGGWDSEEEMAASSAASQAGALVQ